MVELEKRQLDLEIIECETLEEVVESDLIIHVVDSCNPNFEKQIAVTNEVIKEIGVKNIPVIYAFNKVDKMVDYKFKYNNIIALAETADYFRFIRPC